MNATDHEMQILLVEDNPADAELTMDALRDSRLVNRVQWVQDGAEALDVLFGEGMVSAGAGHRLKLVLLDLRLPRVDGLEVLQAMRADARTRHLPVVVLTSSREEIDLLRAYDRGANSYLVKPVDFSQFSELLDLFGSYWLAWNKYPHV